MSSFSKSFGKNSKSFFQNELSWRVFRGDCKTCKEFSIAAYRSYRECISKIKCIFDSKRTDEIIQEHDSNIYQECSVQIFADGARIG